MAWLIHTFVEPLTDIGTQKALIGGCLVAVACGVIGCFIVLRRMAFLGDAISHAMLAGVVASYLFLRVVLQTDEMHGVALLLGSLLAGLVTVALVSFVSRVSRIKEDAAIGMMYTGIFALGAILASIYRHLIHIDLYHFVTGEVLGVRDSELWTMAIITCFVLSAVIMLFRPLQLVSFDRVMAAAIGVPVLAIEYLLTTCTSLVVVGAVGIVGVIQVVGLLVTPAATAYLLSDRLPRMMVLAALFGVTGVVGGIYLMSWTGNWPPGASIVLVSTLQFLVVLLVSPRYGLIADWLRRRGLVPQDVIEDVLGSIRREKGKAISLVKLLEFVHAPASHVQRALRTLLRSGFVADVDGGYKLTPTGKEEARRLMRAHRLWESYLDKVGVDEAYLHKEAHRLEHLHDEDAVDYLDDMLGHPLRDPHGRIIPEDFVHLQAGHVVNASLLREGYRGIVTQVRDEAIASEVKNGMEITGGPRRDNGQIWTLILADGREIEVNHATADGISVRVEGFPLKTKKQK